MRPFVALLIYAALLLTYPSTSSAQVRIWTDANGVTHFEAQGQGAPTVTKQSDTAKPGSRPGIAKIPIDRSHSGIRLGDTDTASRNDRLWQKLGDNPFGASAFNMKSANLHADLNSLRVTSVGYRITIIEIVYSSNAIASWKSVVKSQESKYGPAEIVGSSARWVDSQTMLLIDEDYKGVVTASLNDIAGLAAYRAKAGYDVPKF